MEGKIMIQKGFSAKKLRKKKHIFHGILVGKECLNCDPVEVTQRAQHVVSIHVLRNSSIKVNSRPEIYLYENHTSLRKAETPLFNDNKFCTIQSSQDVPRASLKGSNGFKEKIYLRSISVIRRELPQSNLGWPLLHRTGTPSEESSRRSKARSMSVVEWVMSLPSRSSQLVLQNQVDSHSGKISFSFDNKTDDYITEDWKTEGTTIQMSHTPENGSIDGNSNREDKKFDLKQGVSSDSLVAKESAQLGPGWPLLHERTSATSDSLREFEAKEISVVEWVMSLPNRSTPAIPKSQMNFSLKDVENSVEKDICCYEDKHNKTCLAAPGKLPKRLELVLKLNSSGCKQFSYEELRRATHQFASENLIGEGGCSNVYKGYLPSGKPAAVKILKNYKEAWNDFSLEVDIMSSLKHKHITPLIGFCVEDNYLILVYDFLSKGSLEESLQCHDQKSVLPWEVRFQAAIAVAEALNYLHNVCSPPVIHRDVKSSNVLLSSDFEPQLSDFGLAIWGPTDSTYTTYSDVVGTFGYIAPEYFMHGRVSDKIDVYSFGIVILELLSGKKAIYSKGLNGQESLVKWAVPLLESGNVEALLDPELDGDYNTGQMQRMVLAAALCAKQSATLRPKMSQIVKLLRGEKDEREWVNSYLSDLKGTSSQEADELFPEFSQESSFDFSVLDMDDNTSSINSVDTTSQCSEGRKHRLKLKDYLKQRQD